MFLLDTNVLSAMMSGSPAPRVAAWIAGRPTDLLYTTSGSPAGILAGLALMREGRRRRLLEAAARAMFMEDFAGRVLSFDAEAADAYATIFSACRRVGRLAATLDLMIAAVARSQGA